MTLLVQDSMAEETGEQGAAYGMRCWKVWAQVGNTLIFLSFSDVQTLGRFAFILLLQGPNQLDSGAADLH